MSGTPAPGTELAHRASGLARPPSAAHAARASRAAPSVAVQYNAKRMQMESERNMAIERENKILLTKMYQIMNAEPQYQLNQIQGHSLNMQMRKQEYDRIARENQAIMQRILQREPNFDRRALEEDWKVTKRYLHNISEVRSLCQCSAGAAWHGAWRVRAVGVAWWGVSACWHRPLRGRCRQLPASATSAPGVGRGAEAYVRRGARAVG